MKHIDASTNLVEQKRNKTITMEQLNKVELAGTVGSVDITNVGDRKVAHISLCVRDSHDGIFGIVWFHVVAIARDGIDGVDSIKEHCKLKVEGRLNPIRFIDEAGNYKTTYEVVANKIQVIN